MGIITDLEVQKKNKQRVSVFIDDEFVCGLSAFTAKKFRLSVGKEISFETIAEAVADSERGVCFDMACKLLSSHRKTVEEMKTYLSEKGFDEATVSYATDKLTEYGYLDDLSYARDYVATYKGKYGTKKLKYELKNKGIDADITEEALSAISDQSEEARALAEKYYRTHPKADKRKIKAFLISRGFDFEQVSAAVDSINFCKGEEN